MIYDTIVHSIVRVKKRDKSRVSMSMLYSSMVFFLNNAISIFFACILHCILHVTSGYVYKFQAVAHVHYAELT